MVAGLGCGLGIPPFNSSYPLTAQLQTVTRTASPAGGARPDCGPNVRAAIAALFSEAAAPDGRALASEALGLCPGALESQGDAEWVARMLLMAFNNAAQGSLPFPSSYFGGELGPGTWVGNWAAWHG